MGSVAADQITAPSVTGSSSASNVRRPIPKIASYNQFTAPGVGGYGDPPNNDVATDGTYIGTIYNAYSGEELNFTTITGAEVVSYSMCGFGIDPGCSDTNIRYDRTSSRWVISYLAIAKYTGPTETNGGAIALGVSDNSNPSDGFTIWGVGQVTSGFLDAPRIGISSDKVVATDNYYSPTCSVYSECTLFYIINKAQLYSLAGFNLDAYQGRGENYQPIATTTYQGIALFEAPDFSTTNTGTMVTHFVTGAEGSESFTTTSWTIGIVAQGTFYASQPGTSNSLDADSSEFESAAYTSNDAWVTGNDLCTNSSQLCPRMLVFKINSNGKPTQLADDFKIQITDGSDLFYPALTTTINTTSVLGVVDYTCVSCAHYASAGTFQLSPSGAYEGGGYENGNSVIAPDYLGNAHRWGDINGCDYFPNTNPAAATCMGEFASGGISQSEIFNVVQS